MNCISGDFCLIYSHYENVKTGIFLQKTFDFYFVVQNDGGYNLHIMYVLGLVDVIVNKVVNF